MNKTWLIRTKNNHILGPVSREKIKTLLENKTLNLEDELCSGNGYWFSVKEDDLVQKYIHDQQVQSYNPISEAPTILCENNDKKEIQLDSPVDDVTQVKNLVELLNQDEDEQISVEVLDPGEPPSVSLPTKQVENKDDTFSEIDLAQIDNVHSDKDFSTTELKKVKALNSTILYFLAISFFIIAIIGFYFRKTLLENFLA
jgi:hypothetical protein